MRPFEASCALILAHHLSICLRRSKRRGIRDCAALDSRLENRSIARPSNVSRCPDRAGCSYALARELMVSVAARKSWCQRASERRETVRRPRRVHGGEWGRPPVEQVQERPAPEKRGLGGPETTLNHQDLSIRRFASAVHHLLTNIQENLRREVGEHIDRPQQRLGWR